MSFDENLINNPSKGMPRLLEIMRALRDPEKGCPWDIEQNFKTIAPYTVEEAYEVADAIERENWEDLKNELINFVSKEISADSQNINYNELENKFSSISHVKGVAIYKDLIGNLNIGISQYDPIARIISGKLSGNYINNEGHIFPISSRYSKRVLLLHLNDEFSNDKKMISSEFGKDLLLSWSKSGES